MNLIKNDKSSSPYLLIYLLISYGLISSFFFIFLLRMKLYQENLKEFIEMRLLSIGVLKEPLITSSATWKWGERAH